MEDGNGPTRRLDEKIADLDRDLRDYIRFGEKLHERLGQRFDKLETRLEQVASDHVAQGEFQLLNRQVTANTAARSTLLAVGVVVITVFVGFLFYVLDQRLTTADVSNQIQREAPWNRDKPSYTRQLNDVEAQLSKLQTQVATHLVNDTKGTP